MKAIYVLFLSSIIIFSACQSPKQDPLPSDEETSVYMLQHTVYFYLNEDVTEDEMADFENGLEKLMSIEEVYKYEIGTPGPTPDRDVTDHEFGYSIFSWFKTMGDYEVYADHPIHIEFIEKYSGLWADVKVYDSEIFSASN
jgi:hypothetical protein